MWSVQQQSMLSAMGYTLYVKPDARPVSSPAAALPDIALAVNPVSSHQHVALFKAVMNAARGREISQLDIDIDALRTSPQAKRALWPRLRKLLKS